MALLRRSRNSNGGGDDREQRATEAIQKAAGMTFASALLDSYVYGVDFYDIASHKFLLMVLRVIWKGYLAYQLFQVATLRNRSPESSQQVSKILTMMTQVWQVTAVMVTLSAASNCFVALRDSLAGVEGGLLVIVLGVSVLVNIVNKKETKEIMPNKSYSGHLPSTLDNIRQQGVQLAKAMLMATAAMLFQTVLLPMIAMASIRHSLGETLSTLLNIPAPLALAGYLHSLRGRMIRALMEVGSTKRDSVELRPETQHKLSQAQLRFYLELTKTLKADMSAKAVYSLLRMVFG